MSDDVRDRLRRGYRVYRVSMAEGLEPENLSVDPADLAAFRSLDAAMLDRIALGAPSTVLQHTDPFGFLATDLVDRLAYLRMAKRGVGRVGKEGATRFYRCYGGSRLPH